MNKSTVLNLEKLTKRYADANDDLRSHMRDLAQVIENVKREHFKYIKHAFVMAVDRKADLKAEIETAPEVFEKRKTMVMHGIKIGIVKSKGKIEIADDERTAALIEKHFPEQIETLIKVSKKPIKANLNDMSAADLRKIGVTVEEAGEVVVIKAAADELDKLINKLFEEMENDPEARAA
jgi:hypothetical protein